MSLACHEEIGRVGRVGRGCYKDFERMSSTSRACRARGIWRTTRHTDKRAALYSAADCRTTNQVKARGKLNGKVARHARHPRDDAHAYVTRVGRVGDDVTRMLQGNWSRGIPASPNTRRQYYSHEAWRQTTARRKKCSCKMHARFLNVSFQYDTNRPQNKNFEND